ncbi:MAG: glycine cleavage system protein H [Candidatus Methanomarinus sp.]|uniref:Glycine cleavage system protein H n=1 Tax=Candidatus Methanomarinus sp. TaxID=3386244 RepID=A0AC61S9E4_9EURY|nr:MAG: glycine cleavage system H protein [ANME-2 cluster archaeon]KAF5429989.1 glycine cleavage system H protein [ANME-2 cluster archaeon]TKY91298.1 MAG: glycine cleavage system protein H [ANME-2 cluster archaeon]
MEIEGYEMPEELYYTTDHLWAKVEDDGNVRVGLDAFGATAVGSIEYIDLPQKDDEFDAGDAFGSMESAKWVGGLTMPVTGTVIEVNEDIEDELELLPEEPYGDAWLILVEPSDLEADLENLIHGDKIKSWFEEDIASRD